MIAFGSLDTALRALEARIRTQVPTCQFYFGGAEDAQRERTGPWVAWLVQRGEYQPPREIRPSDRFAAADDMVVIVARCAAPALVQATPDLRRAQFEAATQVFLAVSLAVHQLHQGYLDDRSWEPAPLEAISDAVYPIDYTFAIRAGRWTPPRDQVQPETQEPTLETV